MSSIPLDTISAAAEHGKPLHERAVQVWDLPLRIFHWALVISIAAAYVTAEFGGSEWAQWHGRIGAFVVALLVFRVIWGFIGTHNARFANFLPTPARIKAYLRGVWQGTGHNPLGALSVIVLLLLVSAQVFTGLFSNDDISFAGPWADRVDKLTSDRLTSWHQQLFNWLVGFIGLHVLAILFYLLVRRSNLITPMITGEKRLVAAEGPAAEVAHLELRFFVAVAVAVTVAWLAFLDSPPTSEAVTAPPAPAADW